YFGPLEAMALILASITVLIASGIWRYFKNEKNHNYSVFMYQGFYFLVVLGTLHIKKIDFNPTLRTVILFGVILMADLLYQKTKSTIVPYVISSISLVFYLTVLFAIHMNYTISSSLFSSLQLSVGAFLLLGAGFILRKMDAGITRAYFWIGHLYYPFAFLISLFY